MNNTLKIVLICIISVFMLTGCLGADPAEQREKDASKGDNIIIGVPVPYEFADTNTGFLKGIELALEDINSRGVDGKKIQLEIVDDKGIFKDAVDVAQDFAENTRVLAVVGHWYSDICIPVSEIYEEAGMLMVVPTVSNTELTEKERQYIFQNIPNDKLVAESLCRHAKNQGYKNMVICYEDSSYGRNLADAMEKEAQNNEIRIVDRSTIMVNEIDYKRAYDKWSALDFDVVFLALNMPEGADFIKEFRQLDLKTAILSGDGLDVSNFIEVLGEKAENVVIATIYNPNDEASELRAFKEAYQEKFNAEPDVWAIQGWDSLQLIALAIEQTGSYSPKVLSTYLRDMEAMKLVSGSITFNDYGEVQGREIFRKKVVDGKFTYID